MLGLAFSAAAQQIDTRVYRAGNDYEMKLDSVIGSDNFDFNRWKIVYSYQDSIVEETSYDWDHQTWVPATKTERNTISNNMKRYRWANEAWECFQMVTQEYVACGDESVLQCVTTTTLADSVWMATARDDYEYDNDCHLILNVSYTNTSDPADWQESARYEYSYNENGMLDTIYSTASNGYWIETQRMIYTYDEQNLCIGILGQRRGGGPFGNSWRNSYKYEFEYLDGQLQSELYYAGGGWFGGDLSLDSKVEYAFDADGNMVAKTASVNNEGKDWIVRDVYENRFDNTVEASKVLGLEPFWESMVQQSGMGYASGSPMPLKSRWLSCTIASTYLDTDFTLYCSGFESVQEQMGQPFKTFAAQGCLMVESQEPVDVTVYDLTGRVIASQSKTTSCSFVLTPGLYLVRGGNSVVKAMVQ